MEPQRARVWRVEVARRQVLVPPGRFAIVEQQVYRGAYPTLKNFRYLNRLKLKSIVSLIPEAPTADLIEYCEHQRIENVYLGVPKYKEDVKIKREQVVTAIEHVINPTNHPVYIHGLDGCNITGLVVACLRKIQHWSVSSIWDEFTKFIRERTVIAEEKNFFELFDGPITLPNEIPPWLWQGRAVKIHPTIRFAQESSSIVGDDVVVATDESDRRAAEQATAEENKALKLPVNVLLLNDDEVGEFGADDTEIDLYSLGLEDFTVPLSLQ